MELKTGSCYSAKRGRKVNGIDGGQFLNDRQIMSIGMYDVSYDTPNLKRGKNYPRIKKEDFINWASENVSHLMPKGTWREV